MGFFRKTPAPEDDLDEDYISPEVLAQRRRKRLWVIFLCLALTAAVALGIAARPVGRAIKAWQAERAADQVDVLLAKKDFKAAQGKVQDALALSPANKVAMRAAARFLSRAGAYAEALSFWRKIADRLTLSPEDERLFATSLLSTGDPAGAAAHLQKAWPDKQGGTPEDWALGLSLALQRRDEAEAIRLANKLMDDGKTPASQRLQAAALFSSSSNADLRTKSWKTIEAISQGKDEVGLEALITIARRCAALQSAGTSAPKDSAAPDWMSDAEKVAVAIETHPKADAKVRLFALDLRLVADPLKKEELVTQAIGELGTNDGSLEALTSWLYGKGEFRKVMELLPEEVALRRKALFLQRLDTIAAMGRWQEVRDSIQQSRFSLDRVTSELYIARCDEQLGSPETSAVHWQAALDAAGSDVRQLNIVAAYALKSGHQATAEGAAQALIAADPAARASYDTLLQVYQGTRNTVKLNDVLRKMAAQWPGDDAISNDLAYSNLLLKKEVAASSQKAAELFQKNPQSLPHRISLALAKYQAGEFAAGLSLLQNIEGDTAPITSRFQATRAALLWALDRKGEAAVVMDSVKVEELLPEEKEHVEPVLRSMGF